jgi:hypothetical protein
MPGAGPETSASRIRRPLPEEISAQLSRHARHGQLMFCGLRAKDRQKSRRTARPRRRSRASRTTATLSSTSTTQLQDQHHRSSTWQGQRRVARLRRSSMFRRTCSGP